MSDMSDMSVTHDAAQHIRGRGWVGMGPPEIRSLSDAPNRPRALEKSSLNSKGLEESPHNSVHFAVSLFRPPWSVLKVGPTLNKKQWRTGLSNTGREQEAAVGPHLRED